MNRIDLFCKLNLIIMNMATEKNYEKRWKMFQQHKVISDMLFSKMSNAEWKLETLKKIGGTKMPKQIISKHINNDVTVPITLKELAILINEGIEEGLYSGDEIVADYDNTDCCFSGIKKKGKLAMMEFEADNEQFLNFLEDEHFYTGGDF